MTLGSFDAYTLRARVFPALIAIAPIIVAIAAIVPWDRISWIHGLAASAVPILLWVAADTARQLGRKLEVRLFERWGGKPTTVMMRHSSNMLIDTASKAQNLEFLGRQIASLPPTAAQEAADPAGADSFYERCGNWLREHTRDTKKFALLFAENITYGYRRNLFALKPVALIADCFLIVISLAAWVAYRPSLDSEAATRLLIIGGIAVGHILLLLTTATESAVQDASHGYARQLFLSCETLRTPTTARASRK